MKAASLHAAENRLYKKCRHRKGKAFPQIGRRSRGSPLTAPAVIWKSLARELPLRTFPLPFHLPLADLSRPAPASPRSFPKISPSFDVSAEGKEDIVALWKGRRMRRAAAHSRKNEETPPLCS